MSIAAETKAQVAEIGDKYKYGFVTDIEMERAPKGLSEDTVRYISAKKGEPDWMLQWRLGAFRRWLTMREPKWAKVEYGPIDYQNIYYYSAPKRKAVVTFMSSTRTIRKSKSKPVRSPRSFHLPTRFTERSAKVEKGIAEEPNTMLMHWNTAAAISAQKRAAKSSRTVRRVRK